MEIIIMGLEVYCVGGLYYIVCFSIPIVVNGSCE